jgi:hypothetical protein
MTFPGGAPGGFPGQQPQQGPGYGPQAGGGTKLGIGQIVFLVAAGLGLLNLFLGFAPIAPETSFYESGFGWVPGLLFAGGLLALPVILPGDKKVGIAAAAVTLGATLAFMFTVFSASGDMSAGGVMVLIFGILQSIAAVVGYLFEAGIIKAPVPGAAAPYGQSGQFGQPQGQFGQQPPAFGQQPPPQPGQQTTYAPQQGQFGQQPPGTPPGGFGGQA